ncbi:MAG TPA: uroporphyrinogen-III synthase [Rhizomicrobium sp.]|nr:uroporphyrinogen-III synthase [Rhizomicrobium sp.]
MLVLVTRPQGDAEETAVKLAMRGHDPVIAPLLEIRYRAGGDIPLDGVQAVLVTSANGIRALAARTKRRDAKVLAVGTQSAETARALGFAHVAHADRDAAALANLAITTLAPQHGALFHAAGSPTRGNLTELLATRGFTVQSEVLYDTVAAEALPRNVRRTFGTLDAALFFSPRTARIFADIAAKENLSCRSLRALCISQAAADALGGLAFRDIRVADQPNQDALLALLG